jgi:hypothetical protein
LGDTVKLFQLYSTEEPEKLIGTYLRKHSGDCLVMKNIEESDFTLSANSINST